MLSRTAENLYWLARYVERAEYLARTIDATLRVTALPATYIGKTNEWDSALLTAGVSASLTLPTTWVIKWRCWAVSRQAAQSSSGQLLSVIPAASSFVIPAKGG